MPLSLVVANASNRCGASVGSMLPNNFNNRKMTWQFIQAPSYSGDITVGFLNGAQVWWPARVIHAGSVPNNASVVLTVETGGMHLLLLGDGPVQDAVELQRA